MNNEESQIEKFMCQALDIFTEEDLGFTEDLTEANIIFPDNYEDWGVYSEDLSLAEIFPESVKAAEYQGRKVTLNKPFSTPNAKKKFAVYVKKGDKVIIVRFGSKDYTIKKNNPERKRSYCKRSGGIGGKNDKTTPNYWSRKMWNC